MSESKDKKEELCRQEERDPEQIVEDFNKHYTTLILGGKNFVIRLNTDAFGHTSIEFFNHREFIDAHRDQKKLLVQKGKQIKEINPAFFWLESPDSHAAKYGLTFHPVESNDKYYRGKLNTYMGRGCQPVSNYNCEALDFYLHHVKDVICDGNQEHYDYLISWMAHLAQKPNEKPEVAIILKAGQGTGKGTFVDPLGKIMGSHYLYAQDSEQILGKFNAQLENKLLIFADEFFAGSKGSTDRLKTMITESRNTIERKGQDRIAVPCYARIIMATNHDNIIKIERDERRYLYLEVSDKHKQSKEYFSKLKGYLNEPDFPGKLLAHLLSIDISAFSPRNVPKTDALTSQKIDNLEPLDKWLYTVLLNGAFDEVWPARMFTAQLQSHAIDWLERNKLKVYGDIRTKVGKLFADLKLKKRRNIKQGYFFDLPDLDEMRGIFSKYLTADLKWE